MQGLALQVQEGLKRDPHGGDLFISAVAVAIWPRSCGMTGSDCRCTPNVWTAGDSSGRPLWTARYRSRRLRWLTCWKGSTGEIRN